MPRMFLSLSDKNGMVEFARTMQDEFGFDLYASDGTERALSGAGLRVIKVETYTGFPEMMDGRLKTLHPKVHGGILGRLEDSAIMAEHGMLRFDLVAVNFYPFHRAVEDQLPFAKILSNIDVGGPTAAAGPTKNLGLCAPIVRPDFYPEVIEGYRSGGPLGTRLLLRLGAAAARAVSDFYADVADFYEEIESNRIGEADAFLADLRARAAS